MDHDAFAERFRSFVSHAKAAVADIAFAHAEGLDGTNQGAFNAFRADEHAAKATLTLCGLTHRKLADQLRAARRGARDQEERNRLAEQIDELNGNSKELNELGYAIEFFEPTTTTERRLKLAAELAEHCLDRYARQATAPSRNPATPTDAHARALKRIVANLHASPESLHKHPSRSRLGTDANAAVEALCERAAHCIERRPPRRAR